MIDSTTQSSAEQGTTGPSLMTSVGATCQRLQSNYLSGAGSQKSSAARATLARLRRNGTRPLLQDPLLLEEVLTVLDPPLSERELGRGDKPSRSEEACAVAMSLFAVHMQSATKPVHESSTSFAMACGHLYALELSDSIKPRVDSMLLATNKASRITHIRSFVTLMRAKSIAFDYGRLAADLRSLADPTKRPGVQLRWGRDFVRGSRSTTKNSEK